jgi:hypothetical protein
MTSTTTTTLMSATRRMLSISVATTIAAAVGAGARRPEHLESVGVQVRPHARR